ncbi:hypothetical protein BDZ91DRAFT_647235 [Kalaharituber pfeilii]|nr:hypothetical protein BDZ91DRAFT_647235 [Kalaharituber pfeilii]
MLNTEILKPKSVSKRISSRSEVSRNYSIIRHLVINHLSFKGRIKSKRDLSARFIFYDLWQDGRKLQLVYNYNNSGQDPEEVASLSVGDIVSVTGYPGRMAQGELSIFATSNIKLLAPCLHTPPPSLQDVEKRFKHRHVDLMIKPEAAEILRLRSDIIQFIRNNFLAKNFLEVQTPMIADNAGGAIARPFITEATEFQDRKLALRIAPELWLKRLVIGGLERIFEIGTQFRNEGIDATHNPEFTTCEFYQAYANINDLMTFTEDLMSRLDAEVAKLKEIKYTSLPDLDISFQAPFKQIEFIPTLEEELGPLPDLDSSEEATFELLLLFQKHDIQVPSNPTLPRLLDKLSSAIIEPKCKEPTFIMYHPECLSPLAKTTVRNDRRVSARIELFVGGKELVNAYEEENCPTEQRRKFLQQLVWKNEAESAPVGDLVKMEDEKLADESFVGALEWGLPPTGGWGMGIDRLCMLFTGAARINEVLTFGTLRAVVGNTAAVAHMGLAGYAGVSGPQALYQCSN